MTNPKRVIILAAVSSDAQTKEDRDSLPDQLRRQRERAARNGWVVIDEIVIAGFSRRYYTYAEFAEAAAEAGHTDALRMFQHWQERSFDILSCRDLSRLGREQSILSEVIARTIDIGAVIMPLDEATIDASNYRLAGGISGIMSAQHIDSLKRGRDLGMKARASRGETIGRKIPRFYVTDADGKLKPDRERWQRFFDDVSELFLEGTSYEQFPAKLAERGFINESTGKPYDKTVVKRLMLTARTWGHSEFNRTGRKRGLGQPRAEMWITGRYRPPPDVFFKPDTIEPIWTGQQREDMIDELERRFNGIRGAAKPNATYAFTRICVCEECGRYMVVQVKHKPNVTYRYLYCHHGRLKQFEDCTNNNSVPFDYVRQWIDRYIEHLLNSDMPTAEPVKPASRIPVIEKDIERLTVRIDNLIDMLSDAPLAARADYERKIDMLTAERETVRSRRASVEAAEREAAYTANQRDNALKILANTSIWDLPTTQANQLLRKILGVYRVACNRGDVTGLRLMS